MRKWTTGFALTLMFSLFADASTLINGAGATFPYPIYAKWFSSYQKAHPDSRINYQSIGSGGGIRQFTKGTVDFGASDAPMTESEIKKAPTSVLHVPTVLGAVTISYNLDLKAPLKLDGDSIVKIFMGEIKKWNDPALKKLNPGIELPNKPVVVVHRSDGSGTTAIFADFLAKVSPTWKAKVGEGKALKWPTGIGAKGNEGVAGMIQQTPGALGYIELVYALTNKLPVAEVKNKAGNFVKPSAETVSNAADGAVQEMIKQDFKASITNADGPQAYPISGFTWLLVPGKMEAEKGKKLVSFVNWALSEEGQKMATEMNYAPLPKSLRAPVLAEVNKLDYTSTKKK